MIDKAKRRKTSGVICLLAGIAGAIELIFFTPGLQVFSTIAMALLTLEGIDRLRLKST